MVEFWTGESVGKHGKQIMLSATQTAAKGANFLSFLPQTLRSRFLSNPFWRNSRLEKHENDPISTDIPPTPTPVAAPARDITCSACGCRLARSGEVLTTGETYKKFLKHDQVLENKDREISALQAEIATLKSEITTLKASSGGGSASQHRPGGRIL